eukprot:CAMPEP_0170527980 /NCGR_PEP_ID=MMETSP0209-20121228/13478_1 /TAXON_ID=665100 ORGANISM="Litonotus pictus, Strain P1" /NCGR_SAMPLE_ID=MMETSP0209 /ASSEMBLY_ACC=CAM_ASM_000301 /LENGTH=252 /DNA_ID=CAMNT_0010818905 /DNA_START=197 /DNA_END=955 /DNA_ORIENTATION=+
MNTKEVNIYELGMLLLPYYNMNTADKRELLKEHLDYLSNSSSNILPRTKREVIIFYYYFHTVYLTKAFIHCFKIKVKQDSKLKSMKSQHSLNSAVSSDSNTSGSSGRNINRENSGSSVGGWDKNSLGMIHDLIKLQSTVFNETNLAKEVDKLFNMGAVEDHDSYMEEKRKLMKEEKKKMYEKKYKHFGTINNAEDKDYVMSGEYKKMMSEMMNSNSSFRGSPKMLTDTMVDFIDIRDHFISEYGEHVKEEDY